MPEEVLPEEVPEEVPEVSWEETGLSAGQPVWSSRTGPTHQLIPMPIDPGARRGLSARLNRDRRAPFRGDGRTAPMHP